nr:hypothetical protein [Tanacetum cinerariifolium]
MSFGLCNAPVTFQRCMMAIFIICAKTSWKSSWITLLFLSYAQGHDISPQEKFFSDLKYCIWMNHTFSIMPRRDHKEICFWKGITRNLETLYMKPVGGHYGLDVTSRSFSGGVLRTFKANDRIHAMHVRMSDEPKIETLRLENVSFGAERHENGRENMSFGAERRENGREETGQDYNFTRSGFKNARTVLGDSVAITSDTVRTYKRWRQKLCDSVRT